MILSMVYRIHINNTITCVIVEHSRGALQINRIPVTLTRDTHEIFN